MITRTSSEKRIKSGIITSHHIRNEAGKPGHDGRPFGRLKIPTKAITSGRDYLCFVEAAPVQTSHYTLDSDKSQTRHSNISSIKLINLLRLGLWAVFLSGGSLDRTWSPFINDWIPTFTWVPLRRPIELHVINHPKPRRNL